MAGDFINYLQEIRGTQEIGQVALPTEADGIYHDIVRKTTEDDGTTPRAGDGIYGSIKALHAETFPVYSIIDEIVALGSIQTALLSLYTDKLVLDSLYADKAIFDSIYADKDAFDSLIADKAKLDSLFADKTALDSLYADKTTLDSLYADKAKLDALYDDISIIAEVYASLDAINNINDNIDVVMASPSNALLAKNYAVADEDTEVEAGTYSAKHYSIKSADTAQLSASARDEAVASLDSFQDIYLGQYIEAPTTNIEGEPLIDGALYFDTVQEVMKVYFNEQWLTAYANLNTTLSKSENLGDLEDTAVARTNLGVEISVDVQPYNANTVIDAGYVHTDNNYSNEEKTKVGKVSVTLPVDLDVLDNQVAANVLDISVITEAVGNLATAQGAISNGTVEAIGLTESQLDFIVDTSSTNSEVFSFDATANTVTLKKPGSYNFISSVTLESSTTSPVNITFNLRNITDESIVVSQPLAVEIDNGDKGTYPLNTLVVLAEGEPPVTLKIMASADLVGIAMYSFSSILATMSSIAAGFADHSQLTGTGDANSHPIAAITGLQTALDGKVDDSQVLTDVPAGAVFTDTIYDDSTTTKQGNTFNGSSQLVQTTADGKLPVIDGSNLTGVGGAADVTYESLNTNGDVGTGADQVAQGNHNHSGIYELADATILKDSDIGVNVQAYDVNTVSDASYVHTDNNFTTSEKTLLSNQSGVNTGDQDLSGKQDVLVSGTTIKTVNGTSVLGSGDITIDTGTALPLTETTTVFTNSTNNVELTNLVSEEVAALAVIEVGDVITFEGSTSNDGEYTIEALTPLWTNGDTISQYTLRKQVSDNVTYMATSSGTTSGTDISDDIGVTWEISSMDNIVVNQAHAGKLRTAPDFAKKALINESATEYLVTAKLLAKWYNASEKLGKGRVDMTTSRTLGVEYTPPLNWTIKVDAILTDPTSGNAVGGQFTVGGNITQKCNTSVASRIAYVTLSDTIGNGETYKIDRLASGEVIDAWYEYR